MSDHTHGHYELHNRPVGGSASWAWILPALFAVAIIVAIGYIGSRGEAPDAVHPGGAGAPAVITSDPGAATGSDDLQPVVPAQ